MTEKNGIPVTTPIYTIIDLRDQTYTAIGLTPLRFTHAQVRFEPAHVKATLEAVARGLRNDER